MNPTKVASFHYSFSHNNHFHFKCFKLCFCTNSENSLSVKYLIRRYGEIFKTHILGCPCVMISSPEAARMVLVSKAHLFKPTYPPSKERMIGPEALFFHLGPYHSTLKRLVQSSFMPSALRPTVSHIELLVLQTLSSWTSQKSINTLEYMKRVCLFRLIWVICMDGPLVLEACQKKY